MAPVFALLSKITGTIACLATRSVVSRDMDDDQLREEWLAVPRNPPGRGLDLEVNSLYEREAFFQPGNSDRWMLGHAVSLRDWC